MQSPLIKETCLDVSDVARSKQFYVDLFKFEVIEAKERFCALSVEGQQLLILFLRGASATPSQLPGGIIPPHEGSGSGHIGFSIPKDQLEHWEQQLQRRGIAIESRVEWPRGGTSLYFRDPDGHLLELLTPGVWSVY